MSGNRELAAEHHLAHFAERGFDRVRFRAVIYGMAAEHARPKVLVLDRQRQPAAFIVLSAVMRPCDRNAQPAGHRMDPLHVVKRARSLHAERIHYPDLPGVMSPGEQHRRERMSETEV